MCRVPGPDRTDSPAHAPAAGPARLHNKGDVIEGVAHTSTRAGVWFCGVIPCTGGRNFCPRNGGLGVFVGWVGSPVPAGGKGGLVLGDDDAGVCEAVDDGLALVGFLGLEFFGGDSEGCKILR